MGSRYKFSNEEIEEIEAARKRNKDKRAEVRLKALELRAKGSTGKAAAEAAGISSHHVSCLVRKYRNGGIEAIAGNHYGGNRRNMSIDEEAAILEPFLASAERGEIVEVREIAAAYEASVGHPISSGQIYRVLHRHGWRKIMPRSRHPKKANDEVIEASKKLKQKYKN